MQLHSAVEELQDDAVDHHRTLPRKCRTNASHLRKLLTALGE